MPKLFRDPLIHFLLIGAVLFGVLAWLNDAEDPQVIRVSEAAIDAALRARLPGAGIGADGVSAEERERIVNGLIRDEVYYREALALGLDVDDDQVRTRLIEKMRYLSEDIADPEPVDAAQLRAFFDADPQRFAIAAAVTFEHVYFSPSQRGDGVTGDAAAALEALRAGAAPDTFGDSTPLGSLFSEAEAVRLRVLFGAEMTEGIFASPDGQWSGPFASDFGLHLVRVVGRRSARQPSFEDAREAALQAFAEDRRAERNEAAWQAMRSRYDVVVEGSAGTETMN